MEKQKYSKQSWWPLYGLGLIMVGGLFLAQRVAPSPGWRTLLQIGVVVIGYGLIMVWLELHPGIVPELPPAEVNHLAVKSPCYVQYEFYAGSAPVLVYGGPEQLNGNLRLNGHHHLVETTPSLPEETVE